MKMNGIFARLLPSAGLTMPLIAAGLLLAGSGFVSPASAACVFGKPCTAPPPSQFVPIVAAGQYTGRNPDGSFKQPPKAPPPPVAIKPFVPGKGP